MTDMLSHADIKSLLRRFSAAIELDQRRAAAIPAANFHPQCDDKMWREWRADHVKYVNRLLSTVDKIPPAMLMALTNIAIAGDPKAIGRVAIGLFAEAVSGSCPEEVLGTAEGFFFWLIKEAAQHSDGRPRSIGAKSLISKWLPETDPLCIAQDPECQYALGRPVDS